MKSFLSFIKESDYKGQHEAPGPNDGAPMHDLTHNGIYPHDIYSHNGFRYYSDHGSSLDYISHNKAVSYKDKPYTRIKIYRAVPKDKSIKDINPGDWVTHNRDYAVEHGRANLGVGKWKILSRTVRARELFTDGNSIHEWGYHPQEADEGQKKYEAERSKKIKEKMDKFREKFGDISEQADNIQTSINSMLKK